MIVVRGLFALAWALCRRYLSTRLVWIAVILLVASTASAIVVGNQTYLRNQGRYALEIQKRLQLIVQPRTLPNGRVVDRSLRVLRAPSPYAIVIPGHEDSLPAAWDLGPAGLETLAPYPPTDVESDIGLMLDGESVIRLFGGLFAIALGAWTITRDKTRGWSDAEALLPIPEWGVTAAHLVVALGVLSVVVIVWLGASAIFTRIYAGPDAQSILWARVAVVALLYMTTLFGIGAAIAWWARSPLLGVSLAGAAWVFLALLGPQLLLAMSNVVSRIPSRASLEQLQRDEHQDLVRRADDTLGRQLGAAIAGETDRGAADAKLQRAYPVFEPEWLAQLRAARTPVEEAETTWRNNRRQVSDGLRLAARLTPGTLLPQALSEVSSVGWMTVDRWEEALDTHRRNLNRVLFDNPPAANPRIPADWGHQVWQRSRYPALAHAELPQFEAPVITSRDRLAAAWPDLIALAVQAAAALLLAGIARRHALRRV